MRFGHLLELNQPHETPPQTAIGQLREQASAAVRSGLDGVWCGEHHAIGDHSFHPLQVLNTVASDNPSVVVGSSAILLPLHSVGELATAVGTLAALASEVVLGLGLGYRPPEYALFEQPLRSRGRVFEAKLSQLQTFIRSGFLSEEDARTSGPWAHSPRPPMGTQILLAGLGEATIDRAARRCDGFLLSPFETIDQAAAKVAHFRQRWEAHNRDSTPVVAVRRDLIIAETDEEAWKLTRTYFGRTMRTYEEWGHGLQVDDMDDYLRQRILFGGPDRVREHVLHVQELLEPDWLIVRLQGYGMPQPIVMEQVGRFGDLASAVRGHR